MGVKDVKPVLLDFVSWTTAHGIPHIGSSKSLPLKLMWSIVVIVCGCLFAVQLYNIISEYLRYEKRTVTSIKFEDLSFPAVTVCNLNPYKKHELLQTSKADVFQSLFKATKQAMAGNVSTETKRWGYDGRDFDSLAVLSKAQENLVRATSTMSSEDIEMASVQLSDTFASCTFSLNNCNMTEDIVSYWNPAYGTCYTFNGNPFSKYNSTIAGPLYGSLNLGLRLVLRANQSDNLPISQSSGFRIHVHESSEFPFPEELGVYVPLGYATSVAVNLVTGTKLSAPYGNCSDHQNVSPEEYFFPGNYTVEGCQKTCYQKKVIEACECCDPMVFCPNGSEVCHLPFIDDDSSEAADVEHTEFECLENITEVQSFLLLEGCNCTETCYSRTYSLTTSMALWPPDNYTPDECQQKNSVWQGDNVTCHQWYEENTALVEIYYESLIYEDYSETPAYTVITLVTDIGGNMGLLLGCSLVTVVEFLSLIVLVSLSFFKKPAPAKS